MKNYIIVCFLLIGIFHKSVYCGVVDFIENDESNNEINEYTRSKRFILLERPNKTYQACLTPSGGPGHCKHIVHCALKEFQFSFTNILSYFCMIEATSIGVCCPDDVTSEKIINLPAEQNLIWKDPNDLDAAESNSDNVAVRRPEERGCGLATKSIPKITGGRPADPAEWPWMAALLKRGPPNAFCGGVLITDSHVLTAAHCVKRLQPRELFVRLGEYDFSTYNETRTRDFRVVDITKHVDFDEATYENDIAILKLHRATVFNTYIWPVCMPPAGQLWDGYWGIVTGWGTQFFGGPASDVLMEVALPIWSRTNCRNAFTQRITETVICAGDPQGGRDSCQGDSGGPLLVQLSNKRWVVVGLVSWGVRCGEPNYPGIYTKVDAYRQWIIDNAIF